MKALLIIFASLFLSTGPILKVEGGRFVDIGDVQVGTLVSHEYYIKNTGDQPLLIKEFGKSCNCTEVNINTYRINPGEKATLTVKVETKGKTGKTVINVFIRDNTDEEENFLQLTMNCVNITK